MSIPGIYKIPDFAGTIHFAYGDGKRYITRDEEYLLANPGNVVKNDRAV